MGMSIQSLHLELVEDMSAEHFLEELRRFIAGRSRHDEFISANDTHFKASKKTIDMAWKDISMSHKYIVILVIKESIGALSLYYLLGWEGSAKGLLEQQKWH